jgi:hypothetical protein
MIEKKDALLRIVVPVAEYRDTAQAAATHAQRHGVKGRRALLLPAEKSSSPPFVRALLGRMAEGTPVGRVSMSNPDWAFFHPQRAAAIAPEIDRLAADCDLMVAGVAY